MAKAANLPFYILLNPFTSKRHTLKGVPFEYRLTSINYFSVVFSEEVAVSEGVSFFAPVLLLIGLQK